MKHNLTREEIIDFFNKNCSNPYAIIDKWESYERDDVIEPNDDGTIPYSQLLEFISIELDATNDEIGCFEEIVEDDENMVYIKEHKADLVKLRDLVRTLKQ